MALDRPDDDFEAGEARLEQHLRGSGRDGAAVWSEPAETRTREEYYEALRAADGSSGESSSGGDSSGDGVVGEGSSGGGSSSDGSPDDGSVAEGSSSDGPQVADSRTDEFGWESVYATNRPSLDALRVSPERRAHILDGDADGGGGHRHGTGNPGKTEFPASWNDEKIIDALLDVARQPDHPPRHQEWNDRWVARGTRDDVEVVVVIARDGRIWSGWPTPGGPGVVKNPKEK